MNQPPAYGAPPVNPDSRPLPPGWVTQFDSNYNAWFYVNTQASPPTPSWNHPLGPPPPPPSNYGPPPGPPPPENRGYNQGGYNSSPPPGAYNSGYQQPPPQQQYGYGQPPPQQQYGYGQPPPQQGGKGLGGMFGGLMGNKNNSNNGGGYGGGQPGYYQQQPQYVQQQPQKSGGIGMGGALALGAGGLVGGALLANAFDDNDEREAYDQGYEDGQDGDFDGGDF